MALDSKKKRNRHKKKKSKPKPVVADAIKHEEGDGDVRVKLEPDELNDISRKRLHDDDIDDHDDDSDTEKKPKRKKKKKTVPEDSTTGKGKKSIRQMKREKHSQRKADEEASAKAQLKTQCLSYISQWKHDKQNWKFMKARQVWLYKNKFSSTYIPDDNWPTLLEYFESTQGNIRKMLLDDANQIITKMDEWSEKHRADKDKGPEEDAVEDEESDKPDSVSYKRARDLIQCLQE